MRYAVGSYTAKGGPGVAVVEAGEREVRLLDASRAVAKPTWVLPSEKQPVIFSTGADWETGEGLAASFAWENGRLRLLSRQPSRGLSCCHLCLEEQERFLYAANYMTGTVAVFPLLQGMIQPMIQLAALEGPLGPNPKRQERHHAHQCTFRPGTQELFVCDLGGDQVVVYDAQADGTLRQRDAISCPPGTGARHLVFDGPDRFYLAGELEGWAMTFEYAAGKWACRQCLSTLPAGYQGPENKAAAIRMDDRQVVISNRGHDSLAVFDRLPDHTLRFACWLPTPGAVPRDFRMTQGRFLLAQEQGGGIAWMARNGAYGPALDVPETVCVSPLPAWGQA